MQSQYVNFWRNSKHSFFILFKEEVLQIFGKWSQKDSSSLEAGGILLGERYKLGLIVTLATQPQPTDNRKRNYFERLPFGHQEIANITYKKTSGKSIYVGEWHTHYEKRPIPSKLDLFEWNVLSIQYPKLPLLTVIVGTDDLFVGVTSLSKRIIFLPVNGRTFGERGC
ncbi:Mov34/MPN/PAD-1 family protein [Parasutterella secunda]|uniref:Mov34/MPN/PAD-1 family protein n=1 Tax=Parasutterella secunda TaxID=626947 RepID=UPI0025A3FF16|nr:Mov34/MPN/PAD-1 family protein [Parasutterella secunda]MDM8087074.1 Mov34/MPN/PAD-1 family protein [Parasutterella secunda]